MTRRNRVDLWGDLYAVPARGMFTGNRGCLVDDNSGLVRHHQGWLWITCRTEFHSEESFARLVALKDRLDPNNVFRHNQNIPPSTAGS